MRGNAHVFASLGGGINREAAPYAISEGQARDGINFHTSPVGIIRKRFGCPEFSAPSVGGSNHLTSLFALHTATRWLVGAGGTKLFKITTAGVSADLKTGLTSNLRWEFVQAPDDTGQGPLYGLNGTDTPQRWDGAAANSSDWTATSVAGVPNGTMITYHNNRVAIAGVAANPSRLYLSKLLDPRYWDTPDAVTIDFEPDDGQSITGLGHIGPYLLVFKPRKTFVVTDTDAGSYRSISSETGCTAQRSIVETTGGTFFFSSDGGVMVTDGTNIEQVSLDVRPVLLSVSGASNSKSAAVFKDNRYFLSVPQSTTENELILEYDTITQTWWIHKIYYSASDTTGCNQFAILEPAGATVMYSALAGSAAPKVAEMYRTNTYQDLGSFNYLARWDGPWHTYGMPHLRKHMHEIRVDGIGQFDVYTQRSFSTTAVAEETTTWEVAEDGTTFGGSGTFGGAGTFGDTANILERRYYTPGDGRAWSIRIESQNNQDCQIYAYTTFVDMRAD